MPANEASTDRIVDSDTVGVGHGIQQMTLHGSEASAKILELMFGLTGDMGGIRQKMDEIERRLRTIETAIVGNGHPGLERRSGDLERRVGELERRTEQTQKRRGGGF